MKMWGLSDSEFCFGTGRGVKEIQIDANRLSERV